SSFVSSFFFVMIHIICVTQSYVQSGVRRLGPTHRNGVLAPPPPRNALVSFKSISVGTGTVCGRSGPHPTLLGGVRRARYRIVSTGAPYAGPIACRRRHGR